MPSTRDPRDVTQLAACRQALAARVSDRLSDRWVQPNSCAGSAGQVAGRGRQGPPGSPTSASGPPGPPAPPATAEAARARPDRAASEVAQSVGQGLKPLVEKPNKHWPFWVILTH